jgi:hypothetical protein
VATPGRGASSAGLVVERRRAPADSPGPGDATGPRGGASHGAVAPFDLARHAWGGFAIDAWLVVPSAARLQVRHLDPVSRSGGEARRRGPAAAAQAPAAIRVPGPRSRHRRRRRRQGARRSAIGSASTRLPNAFVLAPLPSCPSHPGILDHRRWLKKHVNTKSS